MFASPESSCPFSHSHHLQRSCWEDWSDRRLTGVSNAIEECNTLESPVTAPRYTGAPYFAAISAMKTVSTLLFCDVTSHLCQGKMCVSVAAAIACILLPWKCQPFCCTASIDFFMHQNGCHGHCLFHDIIMQMLRHIYHYFGVVVQCCCPVILLHVSDVTNTFNFFSYLFREQIWYMYSAQKILPLSSNPTVQS